MNYLPVLFDIITEHDKQYKRAGDYSVTQLIDSPRIIALTNRHKDEIKPDVTRSYASLLGSGVHYYIEHLLTGLPQYKLEKRIRTTIAEREITGKFDILKDNHILYDIKTCKTWHKVFDPDNIKWTQQMNCYAFMLKSYGVEISEIIILAMYLDWIESMSLRNSNYPKTPAEEIAIDLWDDTTTYEFLQERIELHKSVEKLPDDTLPRCSDEDMFARDRKFAIYRKEGDKKAAKLFDSMEDAVQGSRQLKGISGLSVLEVRHPQRKRCEKYCPVASVCNQYAEYAEAKEASTLFDRYYLDDLWNAL